MMEILIHGGEIVNEGRRTRGYVVVREGIIAEVGEDDYPLADRFEGQKIDATGQIVMPGAIDPHVHFREPGLTAKGDMATESQAAVAGGVTSVLEMPNTAPPTTSRATLDQKFHLAEGRMHTNYAFFVGATTDNLAEIKRLAATTPTLVKLFVGSSTGGMLLSGEREIAALFAETDAVIAAHCEDEAIIRSNTGLYRQRDGAGATAEIHPLVRSAEACYRSTARTVELAEKYGARLHVCHLSTARELTLFDDRALVEYRGDEHTPTALKRITAEACVPHLWFSAEDYTALGNLIKCNPAIKTPTDRDALRKALKTHDTRGPIDVVATDHAPHTAAEKARSYWEAPSGIPSVQHSVALMFTLAGQGVISPEVIVERMCHAPAVRFGLALRGFLRVGYRADIAIVDPNARWQVAPENILSKCGWSPWQGTEFTARVVTTIVGGRVAWDGTNVATPAGQPLQLK